MTDNRDIPRPPAFSEVDSQNVENFYRSPLYVSYCKLLESNIWEMTQKLINEQDVSTVKNLQGRIQGMRILQNLPMMQTKINESKRQKSAGKK